MQKVSSPTSARPPARPWARLLAAGVLALALVSGVCTLGAAQSLTDQRDQVRKEIVEAKEDISESSVAAKNAATKLSESQTQLSKAQAKLSQLQSQLAAAKAEQEATDEALKIAQDELAKAREATRLAQADVAAQRDVIGIAARTQYQKQTDLVGLGVLLGAESPADLAQRLQWTTTIFDTTTAVMNRLEQAEERLESAEKVVEEAEKKVAEQAEKAKALVDSVQQLTNAAAAQQTQVAALVEQNMHDKAEADSQLAEDEANYRALEAKQASIEEQIRKEAEEERKRLEAEKKAQQEKNKIVEAAGGFVRPVPGAVSSSYGMRYHPILHYWRMHWGQDMSASCGTPIRAMADGKVTSTLSTAQSGGLGNFTVISYGLYNGKSLSSGYAHQSQISVRVGQSVSRGQVVGYVGTTGLSTGCHLHLQMYENGSLVNPNKYVS